MAELALPDANLYYEVHQAGNPASNSPPLVLIAGLASDAQSWQPVLGLLQQNRKVVLLDNRGAGRTRARAGICLTQMAKDCLALCNHLELDRVDLLGHSMGGFIALNAARIEPARIHRLVLANSSVAQSMRNQLMFTDWAKTLAKDGATAHWYRTFFYWILTRGFFESRESVDQLVKLAQGYAYAPHAMAFQSQVLAMDGFDARPWLASIQSQTLVLAASEDLLFPPGDDAAGLGALPNRTIKIVSGLAHSMPMEGPRAFCEHVLQFLG